jgi:putative oxidoreductase
MSQSNLLGVMLLRVSLGVMWIAHALLKLLVFTLPGTVAFTSLSLWLVGDGAYSVRSSERFLPSFKGA